MHFVVTNDDGVDAPGIARLAEVVAKFGRVTVVAPMAGVSSCSHHVTTHRDIEVRAIRPDWYAVDGYPADCVRVAITELAPDANWVVSGINEGGNLGADILMSGTASAAREAALRGVNGLAVSQYRASRGEVNWACAGVWTGEILRQVLTRPALLRSFWNANLPDPCNAGADPAIVDCAPDIEPLPLGHEFQNGLWKYVSHYQSRARSPGTDVEVCFNGSITLSAIRCNAY